MKSSCAQVEALHRRGQHAGYRAVGLRRGTAPAMRWRQAARRGSFSGELARVRRRCRPPCGRTHRSHTSRAAGRAAARACRDRTRCRRRARSLRPRPDPRARPAAVIEIAHAIPLRHGTEASRVDCASREVRQDRLTADSAARPARCRRVALGQLDPARQRICRAAAAAPAGAPARRSPRSPAAAGGCACVAADRSPLGSAHRPDRAVTSNTARSAGDLPARANRRCRAELASRSAAGSSDRASARSVGAVLQMVQHLQRRAQRVGRRVGVACCSPCRSSTWRPTGIAE